MSITRERDRRLVRYIGDKENIFSMFEKSLMEQGLLVDEKLKDLILSQFFEKGEVGYSENAKKLGEFNATAGKVISVFDRGKILPACTVTLDSASKDLYDRYLQSWWSSLYYDCNKKGKQIDKHSIKSSRIFVAELFVRLMLQALREDDYKLLPPDKDKMVWVKVMESFADKLIHNSGEYKVTFKGDFAKSVLQPIIIEWINPLGEMLVRIDELNTAEKILYNTSKRLERLDLQCKRFIVAHLAYKDKNKKWNEELRSITMVDIRLKEQENNSYYNLSKSKEITDPERCAMAILSKDSIETDDKTWQLKYKTVDLYSFKKINKETAMQRKLICTSHKKREELRALYAYLHFNARIMGMIDKLCGLIKLFGLIPFLEKLEFGNIDNLIRVSLGAFKQIVNLNNLKYLEGSNLYNELNTFTLTYAILKPLSKLSFSELNNRELRDNIKAECIYTLKALMADSEALDCSVVTPASRKMLEKYFDEEDRRILGFDNVNAVSVSSSSIVAFKDSVESPMERIFSVKSLPINLSPEVCEITEGYLKLYFKHIHLLAKLNMLYDVFRQGGEVGFISMYKEEKTLAQASEFVKKIKPIIDEFSNSHRLETQEGHKYPEYWEIRSQEVFCLKFLCVYAAVTGNNGILENLCRRLIKQPDLRRNLGLVQCYRGLKENIGPLVEEVESSESYAIISVSESSNKHAMISSEEKAAFLTAQEENVKLKEQLKENVVVIKVLRDENDKQAKQIETYKASNLEKDSLLNAAEIKSRLHQENLAKKDQEIRNLMNSMKNLSDQLKKVQEKDVKKQANNNSSSGHEDDAAESFSQEGSYVGEATSTEEKKKPKGIKRAVSYVRRVVSPSKGKYKMSDSDEKADADKPEILEVSTEEKKRSKEITPSNSGENTDDAGSFSIEESYTDETSGKSKEKEKHKKLPIVNISIFGKRESKSKLSLSRDEKSESDKAEKSEASAGALSHSTTSTSLSGSPKSNE